MYIFNTDLLQIDDEVALLSYTQESIKMALLYEQRGQQLDEMLIILKV
jgi:hypothetical protein